jgi:hypothetical protein
LVISARDAYLNGARANEPPVHELEGIEHATPAMVAQKRAAGVAVHAVLKILQKVLIAPGTTHPHFFWDLPWNEKP